MNDIVRFGVIIGIIIIAIIVIGSVIQNSLNPKESKKTLCAEMVGHLNWLSLFNVHVDRLKADIDQQCLLLGKES